MNNYLLSLLEQEGIRCTVRNRYLGGAIGELPVNEGWPEIWVTHDEDADEARRIIEQITQTAVTDADPWHCDCGEDIEGQFSACWNCGGERPRGPGPAR